MKSKLTRQIALQAALVIFGAMLAYAVFQYWSEGAHPVTLLVSHLWHSVVLGALIYLALLWRLRTLLFRPLDEVMFHAYEISKGAFKRKAYPQAGNEVDQLTTMINWLAGHLNQAQTPGWKKHAETIERHLEYLHQGAETPPAIKSELVVLRAELQQLEISVMKLTEAAAYAPKTTEMTAA